MQTQLYTYISHEGEVVPLTAEDLHAFKSSLQIVQGGKQVLVDLDDTLRCSVPRRHLLPQEPHSPTVGVAQRYKTFDEAAITDTPISAIVDMVKSLSAHYSVMILSACGSTEITTNTAYQQIIEWGIPFDGIILRGRDNHLEDHRMKRDFVIRSGIALHPADTICIDNNLKNCEMFNKLGFPTLHYLAV